MMRDRSTAPTASDLARLHHARMLGHLAADQRAPRDATTLGDTRHQLLHLVTVELPDRHVVEEEERLRALAHEIVDAHRD
jgi:hypothetical protein